MKKESISDAEAPRGNVADRMGMFGKANASNASTPDAEVPRGNVADRMGMFGKSNASTPERTATPDRGLKSAEESKVCSVNERIRFTFAEMAQI